MDNLDSNFTKRLLSQQSMDPGLQEKYRKELKDMLEVKIEGGKKVLNILIASIQYLIGLASLFLSIYFPFYAVDLFRYALIILGVGLIALSIQGTIVIINGVYKYRTHGNLAAAIIFYCFIAVWILLFFAGSSEPLVGILASIIFALAVAKMVANLIRQSKLDERERLLRQEYRMAGEQAGQ